MLSFSYHIKTQKRKSIGLYILPNGEVEVRTPKRVSKKAVAEFVHQNQAWVESQINKQAQFKSRQPECVSGAKHYLLGAALSLQPQIHRQPVLENLHQLASFMQRTNIAGSSENELDLAVLAQQELQVFCPMPQT